MLYPADGNATAALTAAMADSRGIAYMRTTREKTPKLYDAGEGFPVGGSKVVRSTGADRITIVAAGVTVFEALKAADELEVGEGVPVRVIDLYSVKPTDGATLRAALDETGHDRAVEDHWLEGGIGDAVLDALAEDGATLSGRVVKLGVTEMPFSGTPEELRDWAGISAARIADRVRELVA